MKFNFSFFIIITLCFLPIKTHNNCWEIVYSICCCYCKDEQETPTNNQTISSSNSIHQTYNSTQNNIPNNSNKVFASSKLSSTASSIDAFNKNDKKGVKTISSNQEVANSNSPHNFSFSHND